MKDDFPAPDTLPPSHRDSIGDLPSRESHPVHPAAHSESTPPTTTNPIFQKTLEILRGGIPDNLSDASLTPTPIRTRAQSDPSRSVAQTGPSLRTPPPRTPNPRTDPQEILPARMLNEFVYCPRLFYYEHVEGVFLDSADTLRGSAIHKKVDAGKGDLPPASKARTDSTAAAAEPSTSPTGTDVIHSRSVTLGSERLGALAKLDLIEVRGDRSSDPQGELFIAREVVPVDYKAGAPREGRDENELWPTDRMQLGLQILLLRDNGYLCHEGVIYYRAAKQRVRLEMTPDLEAWIISQIGLARETMRGPIPPPLVASPKCVRCSLAPVCLPDETTFLSRRSVPEEPPAVAPSPSDTPAPNGGSKDRSSSEAPRRLIAARDDTRAVYLNTPGLRVGRKDETLTVKDENTLVDEVRFHDIHHVALFGNIQLTTQAIQALCDADIPITYFSGGGWFYGITRGHGLKNVFLRIEQFRFLHDEGFALGLARQFVHGKIRNHRTLLMRNHRELPAATSNRLREAANDALEAGSMEQLLGVEGAAAAAYFEQFAGMLKLEESDADEIPGAESPEHRSSTAERKLDFHFAGRNRRPPTDPVNAMLSLAYSLLSKDCCIAAFAVGFDPYVGFYHQPRFGRPALALDLMEEFRPLVAESAVITAINTRVVTPTDFVRAGQAVNLTAAGRKRFFHAYEQRMSTLLTHPVFDYKVSYRRAMELQARILAKVLTGEIPEYLPLMTR